MTFTFDANGNLTQRADNAGNTTSYVYDNLNRRTSETFPGARTNTYDYDKSSNLTSVTDASRITRYSNDEINRLASLTTPKVAGGTEAITYTYSDTAGPTTGGIYAPVQQKATFPGGLVQESDSDLAGNQIINAIRNSSSTDLLKLTYDHTNGSSTTPLIQNVKNLAGDITSYTYGTVDRLTRAKTLNGTTPIDDWHYTYDSTGNRLTRTHTIGSGTASATTYTYNAANQLCWSAAGTPASPTCGTVPSGATTYAFDPAGNRTTGSASYDPLERLTSLGGTALGYLSPGNGELVSYGTQAFQNNLMGLAREIPATGSTTALIRQPNGALIAQRTGTTAKQWIFTDQLGSTIAMADSTANSLSRTYTYDPDGNPSTSGSAPTTDVLFAGGHRPNGNLYHYGARYYAPSTATWTQQDPINQITSLRQANRYGCVAGNPINQTDASGLFALNDHDPMKVLNEALNAGADTEHYVYKTALRAARRPA